MTLSDKRLDYEWELGRARRYNYSEEDVKQFIKKLKDYIRDNLDESIEDEKAISFHLLMQGIDKLAGKELVEENKK